MRKVLPFGFFSLLFFSVFICAQTSHQNSFPPLEQWKAAVLRGDSAALNGMYSSDPAVRITTPAGESNSAASEIAFWTGLKPRRIKLDVIQSEAPQMGTQQMIFQIEVASAAQGHTLYISEGQLWQKQGEHWRLVAVKRTDATRLQQPLSTSKEIYNAMTDAHAEIKHALAVAAREHKRVLVVFGANWCYDCHVLDLAFHRPDVAAVLSRNFEVVHVDVGQGDKNQDLMQQYDVPMKRGIPAVAVLDSGGKLLASQKNGEFEKARALAPEDLLQFLNKWKPSA